ncbi:MAG: flavohemoprotein [Streptosporangiales bacterium]|nr:flavohemoprotein [Streptosporangiales bacterium]
MFSRHPEVRAIFPPMMDIQRDRFLVALGRIVAGAARPQALGRYLAGLARDHRKHGVRPEHYDAVGGCLLATLREHLGEGWDERVERAWVTAYQHVSSVMIAASEEADVHAPPYWTARVVEHELRTPDIAVITVLPDAPYPFRPGQHATLMTARWPRVWRPYSIANAPRPDQALTFHVRVVPGGWVSTALAHHTAVGDTLRLGPPMGQFGAIAPTPGSLVCAAGGTGLAPIKSIIEETIAQPSRPTVELFFGARTGQELYDLSDLMRLSQRHGDMHLVTTVSAGAGPDGSRTVADALAGRKLGTEDTVLLCGSAAMVRATHDRLLRMGVPRTSINFESGDAPAVASRT